MATLPTLSAEQAYQAMFAFLEAYWRRGGCTDDQIADLLSGLEGGAGQTADPASWGEWLEAVSLVTGFRLPEL